MDVANGVISPKKIQTMPNRFAINVRCRIVGQNMIASDAHALRIERVCHALLELRDEPNRLGIRYFSAGDDGEQCVERGTEAESARKFGLP